MLFMPGVDLSYNEKIDMNSIQNEIIWNNSKIALGGKSIYIKEWKEKGIIYVGQLFHGGSIKNFETLRQEYNLINDVLKYINSLGSKSSIDIHNMDSKLIFIAGPIIGHHLTHIFNLSITQGIVPDDWKIARVTPIYKGKGSRDEPGNYRPISVICHIAKIIEKIINVQLLDYLQKHDFISIDQSAYLKHHSTQTSLHRVIDDWLENMNDGLLTGACFLDIQKCFDTIDHDLLLAKLECYGIREHESSWFKSYLTKRTQKTRANGMLSG